MSRIKKEPKTQPSHLFSHLGFWMRLVSNHVSSSFARHLDRRGVTLAEWVVLREMYQANQITSPGRIAELTGLTKGAISKLISQLLEKKLVSRKESKQDRRYQDIQLTPKGLYLIPKLAAVADQNDASCFAVLSKSEQKSLSKILMKLADTYQIKTLPIE